MTHKCNFNMCYPSRSVVLGVMAMKGYSTTTWVFIWAQIWISSISRKYTSLLVIRSALSLLFHLVHVFPKLYRKYAIISARKLGSSYYLTYIQYCMSYTHWHPHLSSYCERGARRRRKLYPSSLVHLEEYQRANNRFTIISRNSKGISTRVLSRLAIT